jgi:hypothetical protein
MGAVGGFVKERAAGPVPGPGVFTVGGYTDRG